MMKHEQVRVQRALKVLMKKNKATYQSMAQNLKVSPATIKRRLNGDDLSIQQIKEFAECLSVSFYELIELSKDFKREPHLFTPEQESILAAEFNLMKMFRLILAGFTFAEIKQHLNLTDKQLRRSARELEKVGLAMLLPADRLIPIAHFPFRWQPNGKLEKTYNKHILENLFQRMRADSGKAGLLQKFEFSLSPEIYRSYCEEVRGTFEKYRNLSEIQLSSRLKANHLVSGVLFIDQFSLWEAN